jgi:hypothetical protein
VKRVLRRAWRCLLPALSLALAVTAVGAWASGSTGWNHLGDKGSSNAAVYVLSPTSDAHGGHLLVGGNFTRSGGKDASHFDVYGVPGPRQLGGFGSNFAPLNGDVHAIAWDGPTSQVYVGGNFTNAGGDPNADFLAFQPNPGAVGWKPVCANQALGGSVSALQIIGSTLYVGGSFQNGAGLTGANYLIACNLNTGTATAVGTANDLNGGVYALTADANGTLYVGGQFINAGGISAADHIVAWDGAWHALGSGVDDYVRSLAASGQNVYVGTDSVNVAGIPQADHIARWNGSFWSALGANTAGTDGWLPQTAFLYAIAATSSQVVVTGSFQNANGNPLADSIASFDGTNWSALGSNGAGNGPWSGNGLAVAIIGKDVYVGGNFTTAGGDPKASYIARYGAAPINTFTVGAVTRNLKSGTAILTAKTRGYGTMALRGAGVVASTAGTAAKSGRVKLTVKAHGASKQQLDQLGHVTVKVKITFTPTGGTPRTRAATVVLEKRL